MGRIGKTASSIWRLSPQKIYHWLNCPSAERKITMELKRISAYPRFTGGEASLSGQVIAFNDSAAFLYQYEEIFRKCNYKFTASVEEPLIYDCGANIGLSVIYFKTLYPKSIIKAFEADPDIAELLSNNIRINRIDGIQVYNKAVWDNDSSVNFSPNRSDGGAIKEQTGAINVSAIRLKSLLEKEKKVDLLKLDIEGAEARVLKDCCGTLHNVENIFIEYHSHSDKEQELHILLKILKDAGFRYFIQPISDNHTPFLSFKIKREMDLQLNIYALNMGITERNENFIH